MISGYVLNYFSVRFSIHLDLNEESREVSSGKSTLTLALSVSIPVVVVILLAAVFGYIRYRRFLRMRGSAVRKRRFSLSMEWTRNG